MTPGLIPHGTAIAEPKQDADGKWWYVLDDALSAEQKAELLQTFPNLAAEIEPWFIRQYLGSGGQR